MRANELIECDLNDVQFIGTAPFSMEKTYSGFTGLPNCW